MSGAKSGMSVVSGKVLLAVALFVIAAWVASLFFVPFVVSRIYQVDPCSKEMAASKNEHVRVECEAKRMAAYGTFGDSFGAINALFTGLALAGVVLTLFLHSESARRTAKPFVVPQLRRGNEDARISIGTPTRVGAVVRLPLEALIPIDNASEHPALNISLSLSVNGVNAIGTDITDVPLAARSVTTCHLKLEIVGDEAVSFERLLSSDGVNFTIRTEYESVERVRWFSEASYLLRISKNRPDDTVLLQNAINGNLTDENPWTAQATVDLEYSTISGSWKYGEIKRGRWLT
jgi:hypothetical protein